MKRTIIIICMFFFSNVFSQNNFDYKKTRIAFGLNLINNKSKTTVKRINDEEKIQGKYLGQIKTKSGKIYYIVESSYVFNLKNSPTAESHIFIYNNKRQYVGYYYLSQINELPNKLEKNKLYFKNKDCKEETIINFENGIPRTINLKCNNEDNYYEFQN